MTPETKPRLRRELQFFTHQDENVPELYIHDPEGYVEGIEALHRGVLGILQYFNGDHTLAAIAQDLGDKVTLRDLVGFATQLDTALFFEGDGLDAARKERSDWIGATVRPPAHAGRGYPIDDEGAAAFLDEHLAAGGEQTGSVTRLIAPHIDLQLGSEIHGQAHARLRAGGRPDLVVVLGVAHQSTEHPFVACRKDFATPRGTVRYDAKFVDALEEHYGESISDGVLVHKTEHSIEFQALWLAHHWAEDPPAMVPILVRGFHESIEAGESPSGLPHVERFLAALRKTMAEDGRHIVVLASVDLAHVGPIYDHDEGLDEDGERELAVADRPLLDAMVHDDAEGFFEAIAAEKNRRHVCGVAPIYLTLRLGGGEGELLGYGQGRIHPESGSVVSYAAIAYPA
ncbi:MAG: AmmeMemoRadiSam system protein B [Planctomycetota bacterium]